MNKATRYALYAAVDMAAAKGAAVTVQEVAARWRVPAAACAKAIQRLVRAGIAAGTRGARGGYRLAKPATRITVLDVVSAFEPKAPAGREPNGRGAAGTPESRVGHLFVEVEEAVRMTYASVTLATLAGADQGSR